MTTTSGKANTTNGVIPSNMRLNEGEERLEFVYRWYKGKYLISIIAAPVFAFFLIQSDYITGDFDSLTLSAIVLLAFAGFTMYYSLAKLVNKTKIGVTHQNLKVRHGPVPLGRDKKLNKQDVTQLYVTKHRTGHRYHLYSTTYQINVILRSNEVITLVKGLRTPEQGRFIENKIEDFLQITDIYVEGELSKDPIN